MNSLEYILTNTYKADMVSYMETHPEEFQNLILLAVSDKQPYATKASWLLWSCMQEEDVRVEKHMDKIVSRLSNANDSQLRDLLIVISKMEVGEKLEGVVFDKCVTVWKTIDKKPSVRYSAFKVMVKLAQKYCELKEELILLTEEQYLETLSPTARKAILQMI